jgi:aminopeptidase N
MKKNLIGAVTAGLMFAGLVPALNSQARKTAPSAGIEVRHYDIKATLTPDAHEIEAVAAISLKALREVDSIALQLSENLQVRRVLDAQDIELDFGQNETGPGSLSVHFEKPLAAGQEFVLKVEYQGGFDRDRFSRMYARDAASAYIGMEGTYLMYSAKWFPVHRFLEDRATSRLEVTVPLGMTVIGPGTQLPVVTRGVREVFAWQAKSPILPGSFVAGQYFRRSMRIGDFTIECFSRGNDPDALGKSAEEAAKILEYYQKNYGPSASGSRYRLVEVDDRLASQPGTLGTIFVTRRELAQPSPPVRDLARRIAYQWWQESVGAQSTEDLWLVDGMAYFSAAQYMGATRGAEAFRAEIDSLAVLALKFESKSAVRMGAGLGYRNDKYESVVAGKGAWILNMLRGLMGEAKFSQLVRQYCHDFSGKGGSTASFRKLAEKHYGKELGWYFAEWIDTIGVPEFEVDYVVLKTPAGFRVTGSVKQDRDLFRMPIEVAVVSGGQEQVQTVELSGKSASFDIAGFAMPEKVVLDPRNKILRDSRELQTSVQLALGDDLRQQGDYVEAIRAYQNALKISPQASLAHFRLAQVFYEQFNLEAAAKSFRDALNGDRNPKWIEVWCYIYLGKIFDILGQRQRAMAEYTKAVNTKDDTDGAQAEAARWLAEPFTRERTVMQMEE